MRELAGAFWNITILLTFAYAVFILGHSGWWFLLMFAVLTVDITGPGKVK